MLTQTQQTTMAQLTTLALQEGVRIQTFVAAEDGLSVKAILSRGRQVYVTYDRGLDLYNVRVYKFRGVNFETSKEFSSIYADQLGLFLTSKSHLESSMEWSKGSN